MPQPRPTGSDERPGADRRNVEQRRWNLSELAAASQGAVGALQASQAANQLLALAIKQQLQLQNLMASQFRERAHRARSPGAG